MPDVNPRKEERIQFVTEQDGMAERQLKSALCKLFAAIRAVERAYLVRVRYGTRISAEVALALIAAPGREKELVVAIHKVFLPLFGVDQYLDVLFLSAVQETDVVKVCRPFFRLDSSVAAR